jgi:hypothetical protein
VNIAQQLGHLAHPRDRIEALGVLLQTIEVFELRLQVGLLTLLRAQRFRDRRHFA